MLLLKTYLDIPVSLASLTAALTSEPERCFAGLGERAVEESEQLLAEARLADGGRGSRAAAAADGPGPPLVRLRLGKVQARDHLVTMPLELHVMGSGGLRSMQGTLDAARLGARRTYLSLSLQVDGVPKPIERTLQRAVYHRVVEVVVQHFLSNLADRLRESDAAGATTPADVIAESAI